MPLYEYECESDGAVIELIRPMAKADEPVDDPEGKGRTFQRRLSNFQAKSTGPVTTVAQARSGGGGACGCGKPHGGCGSH